VSFLTHGRVSVPVRTELFTPSAARLLGQPVAVVDPRTLLHLYGTVGVARRKDAPRIAALTEGLASGTLASRFTDQDCQPLESFMLARTRRHPLFFAAKRGWVALTDALPPGLSRALTHHVQRRANDAFRMLNRRQARRTGAVVPEAPVRLTGGQVQERGGQAGPESPRRNGPARRSPGRGHDEHACRRPPDAGPELEP